MKNWMKFFSAAIVLAAVSALHAQQGPPGGGPGGGGPGGPGGPGGGPDGDGGPPDPRQMQARMDQRIKQNLSVSDDAWAKLQPLIDKVQELEHSADTHHLMFAPPRPDDDGDNGPDDHQDEHPQSAVESAISKLKKVLSDKTATDDKVEVATKEVEDAEKKAADDLAAARKELKAAVSARQVAVLVAMGVLD